MIPPLHITQYVRFGTLLPSVATSYMLGTLYEIVALRTMKGKESNHGNEIKSKGTTGTEKI